MATYVFLASSAYSGSTLLSFLLGAHPQIATVSAASGGRRQARIETYRCSCGRLMRECPFWLAIRQAMRDRGYGDFGLEHFGLGFDTRPGTRLERLRTGSLRWSWLEGARDAALGLLTSHATQMEAVGRRNADFAASVLQHAAGRRRTGRSCATSIGCRRRTEPPCGTKTCAATRWRRCVVSTRSVALTRPPPATRWRAEASSTSSATVDGSEPGTRSRSMSDGAPSSHPTSRPASWRSAARSSAASTRGEAPPRQPLTKVPGDWAGRPSSKVPRMPM